MKTEPTRDDLIRDKDQLETIEPGLWDGKLTQKDAIVVLARGVIRLYAFIIRKTWGL